MLSKNLAFEKLEWRTLLSATPFSSDLLEVASIQWRGREVEVAQDQWLIRFASSVTASSFIASKSWKKDFGQDASLRLLNSVSNVGLLYAPDASVSVMETWVQGQQGVLSIEPNFVGYAAAIPNDSVFANESTQDGLWGLNNNAQQQIGWNGSAFVTTGPTGTNDADIDAFEAWDITTGSTNVAIGVIDSGIDYTHPDLYLNIWLNQGEIPSEIAAELVDADDDGLITFRDLNDPANSQFVSDLNVNGYIDGGDLLLDPRWVNHIDEDGNGYIDDLIGWDFENNDNDPKGDPRASFYSHGTHVAGTIGAKGNNGTGISGVNWDVLMVPIKFYTQVSAMSDAVAAIDYATSLRRDADVNLVATNNSWGNDSFSQSLLDAIGRAEEADILFVAAALNNNGLDIDANPVYPASFGHPTYGLSNVITVAATTDDDGLASFSNIGEQSVHLGAPGDDILSTTPTYGTDIQAELYYGKKDGTSMAAPHVTGVIGLLAAYSPGATAADIKDAILTSVDHAEDLEGKVATEGRLNAAAALAEVKTSNIYVVTISDDEDDEDYSENDLSLREALLLAASETTGRDIIRFDQSLLGSTITLSSTLGRLIINSDVVIEGLGADQLTISGGNLRQVFAVDSGVSATIRNLSISDGYAPVNGGGVFNEGKLTLDRVVLFDNMADNIGGAVYQTGSLASLRLIQSTVRENEAVGSGGGLYINAGSLEVLSSTIAENVAELGAGLMVKGALLMTNSTISGNQGEGLRISTSSGIAEVINCTIANNSESSIISSTSTAGGIVAGSGTNVTLINTIVADNTGSDINGTFNTASKNNLIGNGDEGNLIDSVNNNQVGSSSSPIDPLLDALDDNGGPTLTHALQPTSPAINAGDSSAVQLPWKDQTGGNRFSFANVDAGFGFATVDVGAVEFREPIIVSNPTDEDDDGDYSLGELSLREALILAAANPGRDLITFAESLAYETITLNSSLGQLVIDSDVEINGLGEEELIISGGDEVMVVFVQSNTKVVIRDLSIRDGLAPEEGGGGIYNEGDLTLDRVFLSENAGGPAIRQVGESGQFASLVLVGTTVSNNIGTGVSTAGYGSVRIDWSTISNNTSSGVAISTSLPNSVVVRNSTISANQGNGFSSSGAGAFVDITNSIVSGNEGAGVRITGSGSILTMQSSIVSENDQTGVFVSGKNTLASILASTIAGNLNASTGIAGMSISELALLTMRNSTVSGNQGTGISISFPTTTGEEPEEYPSLILNCTIVDNMDSMDVGVGVNVVNDAVVTLVNTIVAGHADADIEGDFDTASHHNLIGNKGSATGLSNSTNSNQVGDAVNPIDPELGPLADNGGPTLTHALLSGSPAIDAGENEAADTFPNNLHYDQRGAGFNRIARGGAGSTINSDIGAFEYQNKVRQRYVFYNDSPYDGNDQDVNSDDDDAIALDKEALLPGETATSANNVVGFINGLMIDIFNVGTPSASDFEFKVGTTSDPSTWSTYSGTPTVTVRYGDGVDGSDRVTITDVYVDDAWLQIMVKATEETGLAMPDVFYFATKAGDFDSNYSVDGADYVIWQTAYPSTGVSITEGADGDKDGDVDGADYVIWQTNNPSSLVVLTAPSCGCEEMAESSSSFIAVAAIAGNEEAHDIETSTPFLALDRTATNFPSESALIVAAQLPAVHPGRSPGTLSDPTPELRMPGNNILDFQAKNSQRELRSKLHDEIVSETSNSRRKIFSNDLPVIWESDIRGKRPTSVTLAINESNDAPIDAFFEMIGSA